LLRCPFVQQQVCNKTITVYSICSVLMMQPSDGLYHEYTASSVIKLFLQSSSNQPLKP